METIKNELTQQLIKKYTEKAKNIIAPFETILGVEHDKETIWIICLQSQYDKNKKKQDNIYGYSIPKLYVDKIILNYKNQIHNSKTILKLLQNYLNTKKNVKS